MTTSSLGNILAANLKRLRAKANLTQHELAAKSRLSRSCIAKLESGDSRGATTATLAALAKALDAKLISLLVDRGGGR